MNQDKAKEELLPRKIGRYELTKKIGRGGMGNIYLAQDPVCERTVALKEIRSSLLKFSSVKERFLREARIASQLSHPSIIPIFSIHQTDEKLYYTMPYVEGESLKEILKSTALRERNGEMPHPIGVSVPSLIRIFMRVCEAVEYAHSKDVIHRDLKSDNIMIGKFGEVLIIDWGLAMHVQEKEADSIPEQQIDPELTQPGKVVGTMNYLPPERIQNHPSTQSTDIYSLGVLLYQLLTLRLPFKRPDLKTYKEKLGKERLVDPIEKAPHRDIPRPLAEMTKKCLAFSEKDRFQTVNEMLSILREYIDGRPEWLLASTLPIDENKPWEFQENILLTKHLAITGVSDVAEWVMLMISRESFTGNMRIETSLTFEEETQGIGFMMCVPGQQERKSLEDGYCIWIENHAVKLFREGVEVLHVPDLQFNPGDTYKIAIEKVDSHVRLYRDGQILLHYVSHVPLVGTHLGITYRDHNFQIEPLKVLLGSQTVLVNCLSIPDAFLSVKNFDKALNEYRSIARSFKGRLEGREALFRSGITLLEQAKDTSDLQIQSVLFERSLDEFSKLHTTPGAPLEYLGKSLVYKAMNDLTEEMKCLELATRRYKKHPTFSIVEEHIICRLHEASKNDRKATYHLSLLITIHLPHLCNLAQTRVLLNQLKRHMEDLPFITPIKEENRLLTAIEVAFWLGKEHALFELIPQIPLDDKNRPVLLQNILLCLVELGASATLRKTIDLLRDEGTADDGKLISELLSIVEVYPTHLKIIAHNPKDLKPFLSHALSCHIASSLTKETAPHYLQILDSLQTPRAKHLFVHASLLTQSHFDLANLVTAFSLDSKEHYLYGCYLLKNGELNEVKSYFALPKGSRFPAVNRLLHHYLSGHIKEKWQDHSFFWEEKHLYQQLSLYYHCAGEPDKALPFEKRFLSLKL